MVGLTMTFSTEFLFRFFGSYLPAGGIAVLNFSLRVMFILVGIFGQAVGTASFPFMARLAAENNLAELNRLLNRTLRYLALVIPVAVLLMVVSPEVVRILFQHGRFDPAATRLTAEVLVWLLAGSFAFAAYTVVVRGYFATRDTLFPALFGSAAVLASIPLYPLGLAFMGIKGVALAISVSGILQALVLYMLWNRRSGNTGQAEVYGFYSQDRASEPRHRPGTGRVSVGADVRGGCHRPAREPGRGEPGGRALRRPDARGRLRAQDPRDHRAGRPPPEAEGRGMRQRGRDAPATGLHPVRRAGAIRDDDPSRPGLQPVRICGRVAQSSATAASPAFFRGRAQDPISRPRRS